MVTEQSKETNFVMMETQLMETGATVLVMLNCFISAMDLLVSAH